MPKKEVLDAKKAKVADGYAIGFSIQVNDGQEGNPTEDARRTGTIHFQDGEQMEQCWQYAGAMGRAIFTNLEYVAPVVDEPAADVPEAAVDTPAPVAPTPAPTTGDSTIMLVVLVTALAGAFVIAKRVSKNKA